MTSKLTLSALALIIAAPAFAETTQLERAAGVEAGAYTLSELSAIASADSDSDAARLRKFFAEENTSGVSQNDLNAYATQAVPASHGGSDRN